MKNPLWKFTDNNGSFTSDSAHRINSLYFPLCNELAAMSSISPDLHGDMKTGFDSFLLEPVCRPGLVNSRSSRNFWIYISPEKIWSAAGVSKDYFTTKNDNFQLEAGLLWQKITRRNKKIGLESQITSFIPADEPIEIMRVEITNVSSRPVKFTPAAAIPVFARSAGCLHDHRHVTSLLCRTEKIKSGIIVTPTLAFNESGHKKNHLSYFVIGTDENAQPPEYIYPTQEEFTRGCSDLETPEVIYKNILPDKNYPLQGKDPMAALRFKTITLKPKQRHAYIILMGITADKKKIGSILRKFNSADKTSKALNTVKTYWKNKACENSLDTGNANFDNWVKWVSIQPVLRKIFGCSFLPDFDYGKGGRGWRDLWQDCLCLILNNPQGVRELLINNFKGIRADGSNATIIGQKPGEFIADRNDICRVWMDHGTWPLITTLFYIDQTADLNILFEETTYFKDRQLNRSRQKDANWNPQDGNILKDKHKKQYKGTILEHMLIQNLVQFFNVGPHNHIRLEGADWNDGLDMADEFGESVAFTALYAQNLNTLAELLKKLNCKNITLLKEIRLLLDSVDKTPINYNDIKQKISRLNAYFQIINNGISGEKISLDTDNIIKDLKRKADWISEHIRKKEWLKQGFFNGYYDNDKQKVEGLIKNTLRMTLTGQTFPVMSGIATDEQTKILFRNAKNYLQDKKIGGFRLNTDFKQEMLNLGRAFSFVYGDKENGAFFNHMSIMFAYALYKRGFAKEGFQVLNSIYRMAQNTQASKIYPCLPEYFDAQGHGMYSYLTGSASWYILTLVTQVFGIRGEYGNLIIEPKLVSEQFKANTEICLTTTFASRPVKICFINPHKKEFGKYKIKKIVLNNKIIAGNIDNNRFLIRRENFLELTGKDLNIINVVLR